jgi:simple sugar transport system permease protein
LKAYLGVNEIVVTLMLNVIIAQLLSLSLGIIFSMPFAFSRRAVSPDIGLPRLSELTTLESGTVHLGFVLVVAAGIIGWLLLYRTPLGYTIRITGANPSFARYGGVNTRRALTLAFAIGGGFAALAGTNLALGYPRGLIVSVAELTFDGIVVALLARNHPLLMPVAALVYGYLLVGADYMEVQTSVGFEIVRIVQGTLILLLSVREFGSLFRGICRKDHRS